MKRSLLLPIAMAAAAVFHCPLASAAAINVHSTGTVASGADPYYTITASTDPGISARSPAYIDTSLANGWAPAITGTNWINPSASGAGTQNFGIYSYTYTTAFDLTGLDSATAVIFGMLQSDDEVTLFLNGNQVSPSNIGTYTQPTPFLIGSDYSSDFLSGVNALSFVVTNSGNYPTGFDALVFGTALSEVPESGSFSMMAIAGAILTGVGLRRRRSI